MILSGEFASEPSQCQAQKPVLGASSFVIVCKSAETFEKSNKIKIVPNGYDEDFFESDYSKEKKLNKKKRVVFVGNLKRFGKSRGLNNIIDIYEYESIYERFELTIVGGPNKVAEELKEEIENRKLENSVSVVGQQNRRDAGEIAAQKAQGRAKGGACASDAFFPFTDGLDAAINAGCTAVIQPGGSIRDQEVIEAANNAGIAMVFTGERHFKH